MGESWRRRKGSPSIRFGIFLALPCSPSQKSRGEKSKEAPCSFTTTPHLWTIGSPPSILPTGGSFKSLFLLKCKTSRRRVKLVVHTRLFSAVMNLLRGLEWQFKLGYGGKGGKES